MASIEFASFGHAEYEDVTTTKTLDATDVGLVQNVTATCTITLPATSAKYDFLVRVGKAGITVTLSPNASDKIAAYNAANSGVGADNKDLTLTNQPAGSYVWLRGDGTDGYTVVKSLGTIAHEA